MKKLSLIIYTSLIPLGSMAQIEVVGDLKLGTNSSTSLALSIPKEFCYNNAPMLQMYDKDYDGSLLIYDENLNLKETLKINGDKTFDYQITYQDEVRDVESVTLNQEYEDCLNQSYDQFIQQAQIMDPSFVESKLTITEEANGDKLIVYDYTSGAMYGTITDYYFGYDAFGTKYPRIYFRCKNDVMYRYRATYSVTYSDWRVAGTRTVDQQYTYRRLYLCNINLNQGDGRANYYFEASQTLFNNDESFEYLVPKLVLSSQGDGVPQSITPVVVGGDDPIETTRSTVISEKSKVAMVGFQIVSSDGTVIRDLDFDSGFVSSSTPNYIYVVTIGNKTYLAFSGYKDGNSCTIFYQIDRQTSEIRRVSEARGSFMVSPTIVDKSTPVYIKFDDENKNGSDIFVYSASGNQMQQQSVPAGETGTQLTLNRNSGMYIVARKQPGKPVQTQKVIVK